MWITFVWVIFWELLDYLGSAQRAWLVGRRASTGLSGHSLRVSHLWTLGDAAKMQVCAGPEAAAPPVCLCMHYCSIFLELEIVSFDKRKREHVRGCCPLQFLSYSDGSLSLSITILSDTTFLSAFQKKLLSICYVHKPVCYQ